MISTSVTIDTQIAIVSHPAWWNKRQVEDYVQLLIPEAACVLIEAGDQVTLAEDEPPDIAYDEGGHALMTLSDLKYKEDEREW